MWIMNGLLAKGWKDAGSRADAVGQSG